MKVLKFGGASVKDAESFARATNIIKEASAKEKIAAVFSATQGSTNDLIRISELAARDYEAAEREAKKIAVRHLAIAETAISSSENKAAAKKAVEEIIEEVKKIARGASLLGETTPLTTAAIVSAGEKLSTAVAERAALDAGVKAKSVAADEIIEAIGNPLEAEADLKKSAPKIREAFKKAFEEADVVITQGFIAKGERGKTVLLGRSGSDYSAAIIAAALEADETQIWKETDGFMTADPRIIPEARRISRMTFEEIAELSFYGAKALHPKAIEPAVEKNIPVRFLNSSEPKSEGTLLAKSRGDEVGLNSATLKKSVLEIALKISDYSTLKKAFLETARFIDKEGFPLLFAALNRTTGKIIAELGEESLAVLKKNLGRFGGESVSFKRADLICAAGTNLNSKSEKASAIRREIFELVASLGGNPRSVPSDASFLATFEEGEGEKALRETHKIVLKYALD